MVRYGYSYFLLLFFFGAEVEFPFDRRKTSLR
jgi:hypothetical protein